LRGFAVFGVKARFVENWERLSAWQCALANKVSTEAYFLPIFVRTVKSDIEGKNQNALPMEKFEILLYSVPEGKTSIEVFFEEETFWLSQKKMAELFGVGVQTINYHLKEVFKTNELEENSVIRKF
jgi:hypothetical protein